MNPKLKSRLTKLLALTESSNEHEASNAEHRIKVLCVKHNVSIDDILDENERVDTHWFRYDNPYSKAILVNTIWRASNINNFLKSRQRQRQLGVKCTKSQAAEIDLWWSVMRQAFKTHMDDITNAFIIANKLFGESEDTDTDLDDLDWDTLERQHKLADSIEPTKVMKGITHETN